MDPSNGLNSTYYLLLLYCTTYYSLSRSRSELASRVFQLFAHHTLCTGPALFFRAHHACVGGALSACQPAMSVSEALSALERSKAQLAAEKEAGQALRAQKLIDVRNNPLHSRMRAHIAHAADEQFQRTFTTLHCTHCTHYAAILSSPLDALPLRHTDGAHILQTDKHMFKLKLRQGNVVALRRERGVEKQWRWNCQHCQLPVAYQCQPPTERGEEADRKRRRVAPSGEGTQVKEEQEEAEEGDESEQWPPLLYLMKGALTTADEQLERSEAQQPSEGDDSARGRADGVLDEKKSVEELEIERAIAELTKREEVEESESRRQAERMTAHSNNDGGDLSTTPAAVT